MRKKCKYLQKQLYPENVFCTTDYKEAIEGTELVLHVTPQKFTEKLCKKYKRVYKKSTSYNLFKRV